MIDKGLHSEVIYLNNEASFKLTLKHIVAVEDVKDSLDLRDRTDTIRKDGGMLISVCLDTSDTRCVRVSGLAYRLRPNDWADVI
jgi:hypothetical protein